VTPDRRKMIVTWVGALAYLVVLAAISAAIGLPRPWNDALRMSMVAATVAGLEWHRRRSIRRANAVRLPEKE
jgi:hypothetical protein